MDVSTAVEQTTQAIEATTKLANEYGALKTMFGYALVAGGVLLAALLAMMWINNRSAQARADKMQEAVINGLAHGDGNGRPSLAKIQETQTGHGERIKSVEDDLSAVKADVIKLRTNGCAQLPEHKRVLAEGATP